MPKLKNTSRSPKVLSSAKPRLKELPFSRLLPNITTLLSLCTGLTAIRFALVERYEMAVIAILISSILDAMDGRLARALGVASHFGAELDSLSDFVAFGVAPAVVLYVSALDQWGSKGWAIALFFVICSALRLARFNTDIIKKVSQPAWMGRYFTGVPTPAGAYLVLLPMMFGFAVENPIFTSPVVSAIMLILSGILMISRVPTFSTKGRQIHQSMILPCMLVAGLLITALITDFWVTLFGLGTLYLLSIPISYRSYQRDLKAQAQNS